MKRYKIFVCELQVSENIIYEVKRREFGELELRW